MKRRSLLKLLCIVGIAPAVSKAAPAPAPEPDLYVDAVQMGKEKFLYASEPEPHDTVFNTYSELPAPQHFKRNAIVSVVNDSDPYLNGSHLNTGLYWTQL